MYNANTTIASLIQYSQWVCYRLEFKPGALKATKIPYDPRTGRPADTTNPATWTDYHTAANAAASGNYDGIGFVFSAGDPYFFVDLDGCRNSDNGTEYLPDAVAIMSMFPGAAWEVSQSGEGIHIVGRCDVERLAILGNGLPRRHRFPVGAIGCEFYTQARFMALGRLGAAGWQGNTETDHTDALGLLVPTKPVDDTQGDAAGDGPRAGWAGPTDDAELIERACKSRGSPAAILGTKAHFREL